jgi:hypothetical protein
MSCENETATGEIPKFIKIGQRFFTTRGALDEFKCMVLARTQGGTVVLIPSSNPSELIRLSQAASELGLHRRSLARLVGAQSASA